MGWWRDLLAVERIRFVQPQNRPMLKDIVKNREEQSVRGPSEAKHEWDGQSPQDAGQLAEAGNGSSTMVVAPRSHAKAIGPQAWSPSAHFACKRCSNPTLPK